MIQVLGHVQGVGFRYFAINEARVRGINGWVKNNRDGSVQIRAEGEKAEMEGFIAQLGEGPVFAQVTEVKVTEAEYTGQFAGFDVTYS